LRRWHGRHPQIAVTDAVNQGAVTSAGERQAEKRGFFTSSMYAGDPRASSGGAPQAA
jgi:hypothetical protein